MTTALTTTFTPPASCTHTGILHFPVNDIQYFLLQGVPASETDCYPDGYDPNRTAYYEPGICPSGYTEACSELTTSKSVTQTIYTCCPTQLEHACLSETNSRYSWQSTLACYSRITTEDDGKWTLTAVTRVTNGTTQIAAESGTETFGAVNAHGIQVKMWDGAIPASTSASTTSTTATPDATTSAKPSTPRTTGPEATTTTSGAAEGGSDILGSDSGGGSGQSGSVVSKGAAAGIGIGVGAVVIGLGLLAILLLRRRRSRKDREDDHVPEIPDRFATRTPPPPRAGTFEMPVDEKMYEVPGDSKFPYKHGDPPLEMHVASKS